MRYPDIPLPLPASGFVLSQHLNDSDPLLAIGRFDASRYHDELCEQWCLPLPPRLQKAVKKRRAEYLASRVLARQIMARLGHSGFILHNAADRSPLWPAGIQASLSHSDSVVVVAATSRSLCVGVDVEQKMTAGTAHETAGMLMCAAEKAYLHTLPLDFSLAATLLFSLKESIYKALWPQLHQPMDFHQAELIQMDLASQCATLQLTHRFSETFKEGCLLQAEFLLQDKYVITLVTHDGKNRLSGQAKPV